MTLSPLEEMTTIARTPPQDLEAEQAVLGACLAYGRIPDAVESLTGEDFYRPAHETVWAVIGKLIAEGKPCDTHAVRAALTERGDIARMGGPPYLLELLHMAPPAFALATLAETIADRSSRRREIAAGSRIMQTAYQSDRSTDERLADAESALNTTQRAEEDTRVLTWDQIEPEVFDLMDQGVQRGLSTPWPDLDRHILGLKPGQMIVVAGRPGEGKTLIGQALAVRTASKHQLPVLYASLEMTRRELGLRILSAASKVDIQAMQSGKLSARQMDELAQGRNRVKNMPLTIDDRSTLTMAQIASRARRMHRRDGLGLVVIDHIGRVRPSDPRMDKRLQMNEISWGCKQLAKELNIPVVALSQINREVLKRQERSPVLGDLKETGNIEEDADVVAMLQLDSETAALEMWIRKNRNGQTDARVSLEMWGHLSTIIQSDQRYEARQSKGNAA